LRSVVVQGESSRVVEWSRVGWGVLLTFCRDLARRIGDAVQNGDLRYYVAYLVAALFGASTMLLGWTD
jgi:hypothetical protein